MAMTLRLSDEDTEALRVFAHTQGKSMQEVAQEAVRSYVSRRPERLREAIAQVARADAELLERLSK